MAPNKRAGSRLLYSAVVTAVSQSVAGSTALGVMPFERGNPADGRADAENVAEAITDCGAAMSDAAARDENEIATREKTDMKTGLRMRRRLHGNTGKMPGLNG